jgi:hypothetical protein
MIIKISESLSDNQDKFIAYWGAMLIILKIYYGVIFYEKVKQEGLHTR